MYNVEEERGEDLHAMRAHLSMFPKWFVGIIAIFGFQLIVAMTGYFNFSVMLVNLALLFSAFAIREYKYNKIYFTLCLLLSISFVMIAVQAYTLS
ncbi:hypothetical protein HUB98_17630 [Paenibacillus barcinonensis]|uniref:DUF4181 domain-containing protein n=2 Tax=Paenibacillus barcinonensis TaxID=198119 RepID=A0ABX6Q6W3_PAEBA|nr:hypothetical protein [Paenibacillus barcinonensis]QKS57941.1 hypothetical protein HUB98_17630 [Paenibacillus barcinonensis]